MTKARPESFRDFELEELKAALRVLRFMELRLAYQIKLIEKDPGDL